MYWGQPWTAPWGAPDNTIHQLQFERLRDGRTAVLHATAAAGFGNAHFELYVADRLAAHFFLPENQIGAVAVHLPASAVFDPAPIGFALYGVGNWSFPPYSLSAVHLAATAADRGRRVRFAWTAAPELGIIHGDGAGQLSVWLLSGLKRNRNLARVPSVATRGRLYWTLQDATGTRTVTLYSDSTLAHPVARGARSGDGVVTLAEVGGSGVSGSVTVAYSADVFAAAWLEYRWPARYDLFTNNGAGALDFTTPFAAIRDNGRDESFAWISTELPAGAWDFCLRTVSDTGVSSTNSAVQAALVVAAPPAPPSVPVYSSGDAASGLSFHFTPSLTSGATYRLYRSAAPGATPDTTAPDAIAGAGATTIASTALSGGPGVYAFLLVALTADGESLNAETCACTLDTVGAVLPAAPPTPILFDPQVTARTVTARARFNAADAEPGAAAVTAVDFYIAAETATVDWSVPSASVAPVAGWNGGAVAATALPAQLADGWYQLAARTRTAAGVRDRNSSVRWVYLSAAAPAVAAPTAWLIR